MIVAVLSVGMMQVPSDHEVDMIGVRDLLVAAALSVGVSDVMFRALMRRRTGAWVPFPDCDPVLVHVAVVDAMEVTLMKVVNMTLMRDRLMATSITVFVRMFLVLFATHGATPFSRVHMAK